jgi:hypothetical protein
MKTKLSTRPKTILNLYNFDQDKTPIFQIRSKASLKHFKNTFWWKKALKSIIHF